MLNSYHVFSGMVDGYGGDVDFAPRLVNLYSLCSLRKEKTSLSI